MCRHQTVLTMQTENKTYFLHITRRSLLVLVLVFLFTAAKDWKKGIKDGWNSQPDKVAVPAQPRTDKTGKSQIRLVFPLLLNY